MHSSHRGMRTTYRIFAAHLLQRTEFSLSTYTTRWYTCRRHLSRNVNSQSGRFDSGPKTLKEKTVRPDDVTIYALSTAPGRAAIAIIRVSGPAWLTVYEKLCPGKVPPRPRHATLRALYGGAEDQNEAPMLDAGALVLYFPAPNTATGEDVLEFHIHGGVAIVKAVLAAISKSVPKNHHQPLQYAEPGEFTRRAFYNNRLDLTQIEALGDTLTAETEQQRRLAVRGSSTERADYYESWRQTLLHARGELEALIDFSEDQHFEESPAQLYASVAQQVQQLRSQIQANTINASRGELIRNGINIALLGAPNAGKSSLLNQIVGREAAIVSSEAGTTRDVIDVNVDIGGYYCKFGDLAGLRRTSGSPDTTDIGEIEREGMKRARERALRADVVIAVLPAAIRDLPNGSSVSAEPSPEILDILRQCIRNKQMIVCVLNKSDLFDTDAQLQDQNEVLRRHRIVGYCMARSQTSLYPISCKMLCDDTRINSVAPKSEGIQAFLDGLVQLFGRMTSAVLPEGLVPNANSSVWAESLGASERQRILLRRCLEHLEAFLSQVKSMNSNGTNPETHNEDVDVVVAAESLRSAADCLSKITGKGEAGDIEEVLGVVFEKFCVGK